MDSTDRSSSYKRVAVLSALLAGCCCLQVEASSLPADSIGVKYKDGQKIIIHQLEAKETYYGLSRRYGVPVKLIIAANANKALKVGDTVQVPAGVDNTVASTPTNLTGRNADTAASQPATPLPELQQGEFTQYKAGKGESVHTVSKRFSISVATIKRANGLTEDTLTPGTILKVPHNELPPPAPKASDIIVEDTMADGGNTEISANRYGIREMTEKGIGVWIDDLAQEGGSMLALHKTAPIGTVVKITNPMTNLTTFAKVVGKFAETTETRNAIIVISKSAASLIGVLDRRFQVEIAYGTPNE